MSPLQIDLKAFPRCVAVEKHLLTLPAVKAADPAMQPDAQK